jgi:biuret amidohydrolase
LVERTFEPDIPRTLEEAFDPRRMVLPVYDMQVGIASQLTHGPEVTTRVKEVLEAAQSYE